MSKKKLTRASGVTSFGDSWLVSISANAKHGMLIGMAVGRDAPPTTILMTPQEAMRLALCITACVRDLGVEIDSTLDN